MDVNLVKLPKAGYANSISIADTQAKAKIDGDKLRVQDANPVQDAKPQDSAGNEAQDCNQPKLTRGDLDILTETLNKFMENMNADLQFVVHDKTNRMMVQLIDPKTKKVLKEFPPHELLDTLAAISDYVGALLDKKA